MQNRLAELIPSSIKGNIAEIVIEPTLTGEIKALIARAGFAESHLLIVCDKATHNAFGERISQELGELNTDLLILAGTPHADEATADSISSRNADALIAVGSGTINDICKYASFKTQKPYVVFPTAPSMNGYLSANASITIGGHKKTLAAHLPQAVYCDLGVLARAPKRLIRSGLGDSLCRSTAQADWLLSHLLWDTAYTSLPFDMLKPYESELFDKADKLISGDGSVIELLIKTLLVSGLGMTLAGGSYPASQGEHLIAHTMEMKHANTLFESYHGEQIGVTTLTMAKIQQTLLSQKLRLPKYSDWEKTIVDYFGAPLSKSIGEASSSKHMLYERYEAMNERLKTHEQEIRTAIKHISLPEAALREVLVKAGAPTTASDLGWSEEDYNKAVTHARFIRDRFTFLDLL